MGVHVPGFDIKAWHGVILFAFIGFAAILICCCLWCPTINNYMQTCAQCCKSCTKCCCPIQEKCCCCCKKKKKDTGPMKNGVRYEAIPREDGNIIVIQPLVQQESTV